jgi:hypothetical protein
MNKHKLFIWLLGLLPMIVSAADEGGHFGGIYVGAAVGAYTANIPNKTDFGYTYEYGSSTNYAPKLVVGYGGMIADKFYLGAEASISNGGANSDRTMSDASGVISKYTSTTTGSKLLSLRFGYVLSDNTLLNAKYGRGDTDYSSSVAYCPSGSTCTAGTVTRNMQSVGIGVVYNITTQVSATADISKATPVDTTLGQDIAEYSTGLGLLYKF